MQDQCQFSQKTCFVCGSCALIHTQKQHLDFSITTDMVVSGVPEVTEHHARHVALMSLEMVAASKEFVIPHMPTEPLKIRVGLHSGKNTGVKVVRYLGGLINVQSVSFISIDSSVLDFFPSEMLFRSSFFLFGQ